MIDVHDFDGNHINGIIDLTDKGIGIIAIMGLMNEWMNEQMNEWMNEWMNEKFTLFSYTLLITDSPD